MDNSIANVQQVVEVAKKKDGTEIRGQGKKGPWTMYTVILDNGIKLNVFGPVKEGDVVYELTQDPQYKSWKGKVKPAGSSIAPNSAPVPDMSQPSNAQVLEALRKLYSHIDERFEVIENMIAGLDLMPETKNFVDVQSQKPDPELKRNAGSGSNRDYAPTPEEMDDVLASGEPISLEDLPF